MSSRMDRGFNLLIYPVKDLAKAKELYQTLLGVEPYADQPYYVGFRIGGQEIGLDPNGHSKGMTGAVGYWNVTDIKQTLDSLTKVGASVHLAVQDVGGGKLIAMVKDADGNITGLVQEP